MFSLPLLCYSTVHPQQRLHQHRVSSSSGFTELTVTASINHEWGGGADPVPWTGRSGSPVLPSARCWGSAPGSAAASCGGRAEQPAERCWCRSRRSPAARPRLQPCSSSGEETHWMKEMLQTKDQRDDDVLKNHSK